MNFNKISRIPRKIQMYVYIYLNLLFFKLSNVKYGKNFKVYNKIYLIKEKSACIEIGDNFIFTSGGCYNPLCRNIKGSIYAQNKAQIHIGDNVGISSACIWAKESITIGNNVLIGGDTILLDTDAHNLNYKIRRDITQDNISANSAPIVIENDVLIGTRCIILKGVTIGARSIIGSGSVVTKSIPKDCIAAGNPCKIIRYFNSEQK